MLDEKDLQALAQLMAQQKQEIIRELDTRVDQKLASQKQEIMGEVAALNEKLKALPDPDLMDKMQEELDLHHDLLKLHTKEIKALKKAQ